jgi:Na+-driven multidrug efflux pump
MGMEREARWQRWVGMIFAVLAFGLVGILLSALALVLIALLILSLGLANEAGIRDGGDLFLEVLIWGSPLLLIGFLIGGLLAVRMVSPRR